MDLTDNKILFQTVLDSTAHSIAVLQAVSDEEGKVIDFSIVLLNKSAINWTGDVNYKGKRYADVFPASGDKDLLEKLIKVAETSVTANFEQWFYGDSGKSWFRFTVVKQEELIVVTAEDITGSKQTVLALNDALKTAEKQKRLYDSITSNTPDLVYVFNPEYRFIYANKALLAMWGKPEEAAIGRGLRENGYEEWHAQMHEREIDEVVATKKTIRGTVSFPHAELGRRVYDYIFGPVVNENGQVEAIAGITRDITEFKQTEINLKERESHLRALINVSSDVIYSLNADWTIMRPMDGRGFLLDADAPVENWMEINVYPEDREAVKKEIAKAIANKSVFEMEHRVLTVNGSLGWTFSRAIPILDDDNNVTEWFGAASDITARKEMEQSLRLSESRFRNVINTTPVGTAILTGPEMKIEVANDVIVNFWRRDRSVIGKSLTEAIPELVGQPFPDLLHTVYTTGVAKIDNEALVYFLNDEGKLAPFYFNYSYTPLRETDGTIYGVLITAIDVSKEIMSRKELEESESRFRDLADGSPMFVFIIEPDPLAPVSYWNKAWLNYTGQTIEEAVGRAWDGIIHPDDISLVMDFYVPAFTNKQPYFIPAARTKRHDGEYRWHAFKGNPRYLPDGSFNGYVGVGIDVHEQKITKEQLEILVNERTRELQRSNEDLQQFAHVASHDLKEPVRKVKTFTSRLEEHLHDKLDERAAKFLERIHVATDRMFTMIDGVLTYSTINEGVQKPELIDLNEVIKSIEIDLEVSLQKTGGSIHYDNLPELEGAQVLLYQLFYNLVNNSIKFAKADVAPRITISSEPVVEDNIHFAHISLMDNGIGFDQAHAEQIFETFTRLNSKDAYEGTGLGLSLCKKIVERHGGSIRADSPEHYGATFTIKLPLKQEGKGI